MPLDFFFVMMQPKDYNDLPLGRMCAKIQEQVNAIFQACRDGSHVFVPTSMDVDDRLFNDASFWLRGCGQQEQQEGKNENEVTICRWSGETMRSRSGDGETCVSVVGETDCLLNKK